MTALPAHLRPDCAACSALCCVAPAFDAAQGFGYDKPAHTPCRHLQADFRCTIHASLAKSGFPGCANYDCFGAGQRVMRESSAGGNWRDAPAEAQRLFAVFEHLKPLHELQALVHYALARVEAEEVRAELRQRLEEIETLCRAVAGGGDARAGQPLRSLTLQYLRTIVPRPATHP